jgi:hypothetical protein
MVAMLSVTRVAKVLEVVSTNTQNSIVRRVIDHGPYLLLLLDSVSLSTTWSISARAAGP